MKQNEGSDSHDVQRTLWSSVAFLVALHHIYGTTKSRLARGQSMLHAANHLSLLVLSRRLDLTCRVLKGVKAVYQPFFHASAPDEFSQLGIELVL